MSEPIEELATPTREFLREILKEARAYGFLGPGPVEAQVSHSLGFASAWRDASGSAAPKRAADLGTGGGLPGLVLAGMWPDTTFVLVEANGRRCDFLHNAVQRAGWTDRVEVAQARAEEFAREPARRAAQDLVTARSFGLPSVVAECGAPLLALGGLLVVSEPPDDDAGPGRWPDQGLARLGLGRARLAGAATGLHYRATRLEAVTSEAFPRRTGIPVKRPLF